MGEPSHIALDRFKVSPSHPESPAPPLPKADPIHFAFGLLVDEPSRLSPDGLAFADFGLGLPLRLLEKAQRAPL